MVRVRSVALSLKTYRSASTFSRAPSLRLTIVKTEVEQQVVKEESSIFKTPKLFGVKYVPMNYGMRFSGPRDCPPARPDGHGVGAAQSTSPTLGQV